MLLQVQEQARTLEARRGELKALFDKHKTADGQSYDMPDEVITEVNRRNDELTELGQQYEQARKLLEIEERNTKALVDQSQVLRPPFADGPGGDPHGPGSGGGQRKSVKGLGQRVAEAKGYQDFLARYKQMGGWNANGTRFSLDLPDISLKTLMQTSDGFDPFVPRQDRIVLSAQRRPVVADLIPTDETTLSAIKYMEETLFTNGAAMTAEGGTYGEAALKYEERTIPVEKITVWIPVTDEQLADVPQLRGLLENRLTLMLLLKEEEQLLGGTGVSPQLLGLYNKSGIQTQAKGTDPTPDAIYKAMNKIRSVGRADPSGVIIHPNDWVDIRLLRTVEGHYIWGPPTDAGPERIWGLPIVQTTAATENSAIVADFIMWTHVSRRLGISFHATDSHSTYFIEGKVAIRAEARLTLEIYRAAAICTVTGI